jgi:hypothetical protein
MKAVMLSTLLIVALGPDGFAVQDNTKSSRALQVFELPTDTILNTVAFQPDSPLEFVRVARYGVVNSGGGFSYWRFRNRSKVAIRAYTVAVLDSAGTGSSWEWTAKSPNDYIVPDQVYPEDDNSLEIAPMTKELRLKKEAYPVDTARPGSTRNVFTGVASAFKRLGFKTVARREPTRPLMRHDLNGIRS